ncbi:MAG: hypothetical protein M5U01_09645 [Ardenticatenaceae bacterium]|nr:hypothetical protein [Ardenticatenaceae bacterium]
MTAPATDDALIVDLEPIDLGEVKALGEDQGVIETFLGKRNRILLGRPRAKNYLAGLLAQSSELPAEVEAQVRKGYDFQHVITNLSLLPDRGCAFLSVDFSVELFASVPARDEPSGERPIVFDVRPRQVVRELKYRQSTRQGYEAGGGIQGGLGTLSAKVSQEHAYEQDGVWYVKELYSYGLNFSEAGWRMSAHPDWMLSGDVSDLELVVQYPQGARLQGRFHVAAEVAVEVALDRWLTAAFGPHRADPVIQTIYPLSD